MLTRQAYTLIARVIRELPVSAHDRAMVVREFASVLKADNPAFRADKFSDACTAESEPAKVADMGMWATRAKPALDKGERAAWRPMPADAHGAALQLVKAGLVEMRWNKARHEFRWKE